MPSPDPNQELLPSVIDRLIDHEPRVSTEPESRRVARLSDIKQSVRRDLEWLLNSRRLVVDIPHGLTQLKTSVLTYGLPDFTHSSLVNPGDRAALQRAIENVVARFEPRLTQVVVTLVEGGALDRGLRFRIDAVLDVKPTPEAISFDSVLELPTKAFVVQGD